jgi:hypothetical protein
MARPQGTCTVAAANRILYGLATVDKIEQEGGTEVYRAVLNNKHEINKNNTDLVIMVIDYAIEHGLKREVAP